MSGRPWIAVERHVTKRTLAYQAAEFLHVSRYTACGHLIALYGEVSEDANNGDLSQASDKQLEDWAGWDGPSGLFARFVREYCLNDGVISDWDELQGPLEERRAHDRARVKAWRERQKASRDGNGTGNVTVRGTEHNTTQQGLSIARAKRTRAPRMAGSHQALSNGRTSPPFEWGPVAAAWDAVNGKGSFNRDDAEKYLAALKTHPLDEVAEHLTEYLSRQDPLFVSLKRFAETYARWGDRLAGVILVDAEGSLTPDGDRLTRPRGGVA